jgi:hypothetical protein
MKDSRKDDWGKHPGGDPMTVAELKKTPPVVGQPPPAAKPKEPKDAV